MVSSLRINIRKCTLIGIDMDEDTLKEMGEELGSGIGRLPFNYLGLPVGGNSRLKRFWAPVIERMEKRLAGWGRRYLSIGGHLTPIKAVLLSLSIYYFSLFEMPKGILRKLNNCLKAFYGEIRN